MYLHTPYTKQHGLGIGMYLRTYPVGWFIYVSRGYVYVNTYNKQVSSHGNAAFMFLCEIVYTKKLVQS
jgi:hypothetical protein